jgi:hypothetical protein
MRQPFVAHSDWLPWPVHTSAERASKGVPMMSTVEPTDSYGGDEFEGTPQVRSTWGGWKGRSRPIDLYMVSPMLAPTTRIRVGTVGTLSPREQRAFRHKVNSIFVLLAFTSTSLHVLIIHNFRERFAGLAEKGVLKDQDKYCSQETCSRLLAMLITLCLTCAFLGFCMFRCAAHTRARIPLLLALSICLPMACAVGDVWLESRSVAFCQGLVTCGAILLLVYSSIPVKQDSASFMHIVGVGLSLVTTLAIAAVVNFVVVGVNEPLSPPPPPPSPPPPAPYLPPGLPLAPGDPPSPPLEAVETIEYEYDPSWNAPLVQSVASFAVVSACTAVLLLWLGYDIYKMRGLKPNQHIEGALFLFSDMLLIACLRASPPLGPPVHAHATAPPAHSQLHAIAAVAFRQPYCCSLRAPLHSGCRVLAMSSMRSSRKSQAHTSPCQTVQVHPRFWPPDHPPFPFLFARAGDGESKNARTAPNA